MLLLVQLVNILVITEPTHVTPEYHLIFRGQVIFHSGFGNCRTQLCVPRPSNRIGI